MTTVLERDEQGRAARWVTRREPEWDEQSRSWALAWFHYLHTLCRSCGGPLAETTSVDRDRNNPHAAWLYRPAEPVECHRCTALHLAEEKHRDKAGVRQLIHQVDLVPRGGTPQERARRRRPTPGQ